MTPSGLPGPPALLWLPPTQMSAQGPISGACFGHFFVYAPDDKVAAREYGLAR